MDFAGKTAIVTGAAQGIGLEICRRMAMLGANVLLNDIDTALAEVSAKAINKSSGQDTCRAFAGDASDPVFIRSIVDAAVKYFGKLDIIVANAGITLFGDFF